MLTTLWLVYFDGQMCLWLVYHHFTPIALILFADVHILQMSMLQISLVIVFVRNLRCHELVRFGRMCPYTCPSLYLDTCETCEKWVALILMRVFVVAPVMAS